MDVKLAKTNYTCENNIILHAEYFSKYFTYTNSFNLGNKPIH